MYSVDPRERDTKSVPFMQWVSLQGLQGEVNRVLGLFDTGCQVGALDKTYYEQKAKQMGRLAAPTRCLRMADGTLVNTYGSWGGTVTVGGVDIKGEFDVFDSHGGWTILFGKPLLVAVGAVHDVRADVVTVSGKGRTAVLENRNPAVWKNKINAAAIAAGRGASTGVKSSAIPPARRVQSVSRMRATYPPTTRGAGLKASAAATSETAGMSKRHEASTGASSCETPPARRVESAFMLENTDPAVVTGAFIEEMVDDVYDEFEEVEWEDEDTGMELDEEGEESGRGVGMELGVEAEEMGVNGDIRAEEMEVRADMVEEEKEHGVDDGPGRGGEAEDTEQRTDDDETWGDGDGGETGDAETRVASTGVKSCATPPARRVHSADSKDAMNADEDPAGATRQATRVMEEERPEATQ
jgi:hypothetical protein